MSHLLIIGHRGASSVAPENTLQAFSLAQRLGAHMVELDVHMSKDGQLVVLHDETLDRTTSGHGPVANYTLEQLKKLDAGTWFEPKFSACKIPTLDEVFAALPRRIGLNIELKTDVVHYSGIENKVLTTIKRYRSLHRTIVSSFNWESLSLLHRLERRLKIGLLFHKVHPKLWPTARLLNAYSIHPPLGVTNSDLVWQAHSWGYRIYPWVVNDPGQMLKLEAMGIDGVITDCPQILTHYWE